MRIKVHWPRLVNDGSSADVVNLTKLSDFYILLLKRFVVSFKGELDQKPKKSKRKFDQNWSETYLYQNMVYLKIVF